VKINMLFSISKYNNTPLHYAAMWNLFLCVESLVAHGAYIFIENVERFTPSYLAKRHGHKEIALFLDSKLLINVRTSPFKLASFFKFNN